MLGLLADGHVLIEDYPGLAKTLMARSFAQVTSIEFSRIQFTPDLMPSDVTGSSIFNQREADFEFRPGPIFAHLLLADEINRAAPTGHKSPPAEAKAPPPRGDAGAAGDERGRAAAVGPAVPRARHAEPDRVRRHLSPAGSPARPLPAADVGRLPRARGRVAGPREPRGAAHRRGRAVAARRPRDPDRDAAGGRGRLCIRAGGPLHGRRRRGDADGAVDPGRRVATRLARAPEAFALPRSAAGP